MTISLNPYRILEKAKMAFLRAYSRNDRNLYDVKFELEPGSSKIVNIKGKVLFPSRSYFKKHEEFMKSETECVEVALIETNLCYRLKPTFTTALIEELKSVGLELGDLEINFEETLLSILDYPCFTFYKNFDSFQNQIRMSQIGSAKQREGVETVLLDSGLDIAKNTKPLCIFTNDEMVKLIFVFNVRNRDIMEYLSEVNWDVSNPKCPLELLPKYYRTNISVQKELDIIKRWFPTKTVCMEFIAGNQLITIANKIAHYDNKEKLEMIKGLIVHFSNKEGEINE